MTIETPEKPSDLDLDAIVCVWNRSLEELFIKVLYCCLLTCAIVLDFHSLKVVIALA